MKRPVTTIVVVSFCVLAAIHTSAQDNVRRTPWGDPDIEGIWTNATLTPLQRPPELATKEFFTAEEAKQFQQTQRSSRPTPIARCAPGRGRRL